MKANMSYMNAAAPYRLAGLWLFHQSAVVTVLMAIVRPFMSRKMKERIRLFGADFSELHRRVDPALLPPDFGGSAAADVAQWAWFERVVALSAPSSGSGRDAVTPAPT